MMMDHSLHELDIGRDEARIRDFGCLLGRKDSAGEPGAPGWTIGTCWAAAEPMPAMSVPTALPMTKNFRRFAIHSPC